MTTTLDAQAARTGQHVRALWLRIVRLRLLDELMAKVRDGEAS